MPLTLIWHRLMSDSEVKAFDDMMQEAAKKHLGLDVSWLPQVSALQVTSRDRWMDWLISRDASPLDQLRFGSL